MNRAFVDLAHRLINYSQQKASHREQRRERDKEGAGAEKKRPDTDMSERKEKNARRF